MTQYTVHLPGGDVVMCEKHARKTLALVAFVGKEASADDGAEGYCLTCKHEESKNE